MNETLLSIWPTAEEVHQAYEESEAAVRALFERGQRAVERFEPESGLPNGQRKISLDEMQRHYIRWVLKNTNGKIEGPNGAAEWLQMKPSTLRSRIKKLGIS